MHPFFVHVPEFKARRSVRLGCHQNLFRHFVLGANWVTLTWITNGYVWVEFGKKDLGTKSKNSEILCFVYNYHFLKTTAGKLLDRQTLRMSFKVSYKEGERESYRWGSRQ